MWGAAPQPARASCFQASFRVFRSPLPTWHPSISNIACHSMYNFHKFCISYNSGDRSLQLFCHLCFHILCSVLHLAKWGWEMWSVIRKYRRPFWNILVRLSHQKGSTGNSVPGPDQTGIMLHLEGVSLGTVKQVERSVIFLQTFAWSSQYRNVSNVWCISWGLSTNI